MEEAAKIKDLERQLKLLKRQYHAQEKHTQRFERVSDTRDKVTHIFKEELTKQNAYLDMMMEDGLDILVLLDADGCLLKCTHKLLHLNGIPGISDVFGIHASDFFRTCYGDEFSSRIIQFMQTARDTNSSVSAEEFLVRRASGFKRYCKITVSALKNHGEIREYGKNNIGGYLIIFTDLTDIENARLEAVRANNAKSEFLSNMSHEMRTPLNAIINMARFAARTDDPQKRRNFLQNTQNAASHLLGVINDILDMSKIEADMLELSPTTFSVREMISETKTIFDYKIHEKSLNFIVTIEQNIPAIVFGDKQRLAQVITNLISNAIKFTPDKGEIALSASLKAQSEDECEITFCVKDSGIGISEEQKGCLFKAFSQADSSTSRKYGGTGLGLSISKRIVEMMNGAISVDSAPLAGTAFTFYVKMGKVAAVNHTKKDVSDEPLQNIFPNKTILVAEDIGINREIVAAILESTQVNIEEAENGAEAVEAFINNPTKYDLIFMDIQMPVMDGLSATKAIRESGVAGADRVPIVAMTANAFEDDIENTRKAGMNDHIPKPLEEEKILKVMRAYLK